LYIDTYQYTPKETVMSRVQLALNVQNLQESIAFYSKMFGTEPAKVREGYANFAIAEPPLKLVLIETKADGSSEYQHLNHLGVELESAQLVEQAIDQFSNLGLVEKIEKNETCCFAVQDKVWMTSPDGAPWEYYTVLADAPSFRTNIAVVPGGDCCS
jgi:catechol 2,3-dioxygenase-like lactoylglutathione lyase family enzyme